MPAHRKKSYKHFMLSSQQRSPSQKSKLAHMGNRDCYFVPEPCLASAPEKRQGRFIIKRRKSANAVAAAATA
jgi:hypothetical protein